MKFYIATRLDQHQKHNAVRDVLIHTYGCQITYDWTTHGSVQHCSKEKMQEVAWSETNGVINADVVIVLLPGGRGTHVELGIAIACGKPVVIYAPPELGIVNHDERTCVFYHHKNVCVLESEFNPNELAKIVLPLYSQKLSIFELEATARKCEKYVVFDSRVTLGYGYFGETLLHKMGCMGVMAIVHNPLVGTTQNELGDTPLHELVRFNYPDGNAPIELWTHPDINLTRNIDGYTPYDFLIDKGKPPTCADVINETNR